MSLLEKPAPAGGAGRLAGVGLIAERQLLALAFALKFGGLCGGAKIGGK
jgi:hypothetical protein